MGKGYVLYNQVQTCPLNPRPIGEARHCLASLAPNIWDSYLVLAYWWLHKTWKIMGKQSTCGKNPNNTIINKWGRKNEDCDRSTLYILHTSINTNILVWFDRLKWICKYKLCFSLLFEKKAFVKFHNGENPPCLTRPQFHPGIQLHRNRFKEMLGFSTAKITSCTAERMHNYRSPTLVGRDQNVQTQNVFHFLLPS